jgi:hypothetical protein
MVRYIKPESVKKTPSGLSISGGSQRITVKIEINISNISIPILNSFLSGLTLPRIELPLFKWPF